MVNQRYGHSLSNLLRYTKISEIVRNHCKKGVKKAHNKIEQKFLFRGGVNG